MSYTYRNKGTGQQAEQQKQKLVFGILSHRRAITGIFARITTLDGQRDQEIAQAIWDDVDVPTVASTAGLTSATARSIGFTRLKAARLTLLGLQPSRAGASTT
ncbi:hypothetical protein [Pseudarthrobacter sp. NamE5]|uniref:hypothetical protein n=1 Tax=Pseudarthrobacter sp. NamE5 TaxID=2576839 RepID=UPI00110B68AC|nr:hypothetical protein [Pseudarthrobacter sp. NamE5]TLM82480.1 hypothetical protein FDW84_15845 [Pseudarthrobacter sp. NamE5]